MLIKVGKSTWLRTGLINELTVIFNEHLDMKPYSVYVCTENENFEWSEHDTEEEAIKALNELAEKINRDKSTATVLVRKLEKEGFIFVEKDSSDSRKKIIRLSEKGMKFNNATENLSRQLISSAFSSFSDNEKEELLSLLYRIYENLYDAV